MLIVPCLGRILYFGLLAQGGYSLLLIFVSIAERGMVSSIQEELCSKLSLRAMEGLI